MTLVTTPADSALLDAAAAVVDRACRRAGVTVLELRTPAENARGAEVLREVWRGSEDPVPSNLLRTVQHIGGYVVGAYDEAGAMVACSMGLLSDEGLHSHITGVVPTGQRKGLGFAVKQHQRLWCLQRGIGVVTWTCDPLVRRNVGFNLHALGARVSGYLPDHYGAMSDGLNKGDETDRFELHWDLASERACEAAEHRLPYVTGDRTIALPDDIEAVRQRDPQEALAWRRRVRESVVPALSEGLTVAGLTAEGALVLS